MPSWGLVISCAGENNTYRTAQVTDGITSGELEEMGIQSVNPATGVTEKVFEEWPLEKTMETVDAVATAWKTWRRTTVEERCALLTRAADVLRKNNEELAVLIAKEMGKPIRQGTGEILKCAALIDYYVEGAPAMLADEPVPEACKKSILTYEPVGIVLSVMPWNFPFWQVFRIGAPTLLAGNAMVLKHASNVPQCALAIDEVFKEAGLPENIFRTLLIGAGQVEKVLQHPNVTGVSLTGSEPAGRKVASTAGGQLKKAVMELGGSDPLIVLADADLEQAAKIGAASRCGNTGQTCISAKRFIIQDSVYDAYLAMLKAEMETLKMGDPLDMATDMGPMSSAKLRSELQGQVDRCVAAGGKILMGGAIPEGQGAYYPATIITDVPKDAPVAKEELFGPVAMVFRVKDEDEAIELANSTPFGLGGSVWTGDKDKGIALARRVESGCVHINGLVRSDPKLPFGGIKNSGFGRELGIYGIREFVNIKSICMD